MSRFEWSRCPNKKGVNDLETMKMVFEVVEEYLEEKLPEGRRKSIVMTKLEEAFAFAIRSMFENPELTRTHEESIELAKSIIESNVFQT